MPATQFVICPKCQAQLDVDPAWAGRRARCKKCRNEFELQTSSMMERSPRSLERSVDTSMQSADETLLGAPRTQGICETSIEIANRGTFSRFELIELLGEGAFGKVYKARDPNLGRLVALKIPTFSAAELKKTSRFLDEARSAAALRHKNIVPIYEAGMFEGRPYIVSEFIEGETLSHRIGAEPVSFRTAASWIRDLALALQYSHDNGIIHRDVKSENIMLDANQVPFLMDFGLAKRIHEDSTRTLDGTVLGTPAYMPPEQARGDQKMIGPRSDQYSLAVVLYELLSRQRPFSGQPHTVIAQVISAEPRRPSAILRSVPKTLEAICLKAMSKDIEDRYPSAAKFAADLDCYLAGQMPSAHHRNLIFRLPKLKGRYQNRISMASVLVGLLICGVVAWKFKAPTARVRLQTETLVLKPKPNAAEAVATEDQILNKIDQPANTLDVSPNDDPRASTVGGESGWPADAPPQAIAPFDAVAAKQHQQAWADYLKLPVTYTNSIGMKFVLIPPGEFMMGSTPTQIEMALSSVKDEYWKDCIQSECPQHYVTLTQPIYLGAHEVTQQHYMALMGVNPASFSETGKHRKAVADLDTRNHPVEMVSYIDAVAFCTKLSQMERANLASFVIEGYRLPTEAEWEFASRAGTANPRFSSQIGVILQTAWFAENSDQRTHSVGELTGNAFGLFDISGNVCEWVEDGWNSRRYQKVAAPSVKNPKETFIVGSDVVRRDGSWGYNAYSQRISHREHMSPSFRDDGSGFRIVLDAVRK